MHAMSNRVKALIFARRECGAETSQSTATAPSLRHQAPTALQLYLDAGAEVFGHGFPDDPRRRL